MTERIAALDEAGLRRRLRCVEPTGPTTARVDGREVDLFCTNDYLGLAWEPEVRRAYLGGGAGGSRLVSGNRPAHEALEAELGRIFGRPATLFPSGFQANLGLLGALVQAGDRVASDALNHASIIDGLRLTRGGRVIVPHLGAPPAEFELGVTESLFSMDGDVPRLSRWVGKGWLAVDEAHAVGALGPGGQGVAAAQGVTPDFLVGTLGKAYGVSGAFVVGPPELRELIVSSARAFVYTTGVPEPVANAALVGLRMATDERRERLAVNVRRFREGLAHVGVQALGSAHIVPVICGQRTMEVAAGLLEAGIYAPGIRYPTVPKGSERIRFTLSAGHTEEQIDRGVRTIKLLARG